jgi:homoserine kinase
MPRRAVVTVPASSANLGPGFDCLGLALSLYHRVEVREEEGEGLELRVLGEGAGALPPDRTNPVCQAMDRVLVAAGYRPGRLVLECSSQIPLARGLGSSAAACLAGLAAGTWLSGRELVPERLLELAMAIEGHADNVVPSLVGGFTVVAMEGDRVRYARLDPPPDLEAAAAVPDFDLLTERSRAVLPAQVSFADAVDNLGRVALLTAALTGNRLELLRTAMQDRLHQPYRAPLVPGLEEVRRAALGAGAWGAALSGAGPTVLALVRRGDPRPGRAMQEAWRRQGVTAAALLLPLDRAGVRIQPIPEEEP